MDLLLHYLNITQTLVTICPKESEYQTLRKKTKKQNSLKKEPQNVS